MAVVGIVEVNRARINAALPPYAPVLDVLEPPKIAQGDYQIRKVRCPWCRCIHMHMLDLGQIVPAPCRNRITADARYVIGMPEFLAR